MIWYLAITVLSPFLAWVAAYILDLSRLIGLHNTPYQATGNFVLWIFLMVLTGQLISMRLFRNNVIMVLSIIVLTLDTWLLLFLFTVI